MVERVGLGGLVAALPYMVGYEPSDDHIALIALDADRRQICAMVTDYETLPGAQSSVEMLAERYNHLEQAYDAAHAILVAYGPGGPERLDELEDAVRATAGLDPEMIAVHVTGQRWTMRTPDGTWAVPETVPPPPLAAFPGDTPTPMAHRSQLADLYQPLPSPTFQELPSVEQAIIDRQRPALRAEAATRTLQNLTESPTPRARATLAHLMHDSQIRDLVIAETLDYPARRHALIDTYRAAPETLRGNIAAAAAAAMYLGGDQTPRLEAVLTHANPSSPLTQAITECSQRAMNPADIRKTMSENVREVIRHSDTHWTAPINHDRSTGVDSVRRVNLPSLRRRTDPST